MKCKNDKNLNYFYDKEKIYKINGKIFKLKKIELIKKS